VLSPLSALAGRLAAALPLLLVALLAAVAVIVVLRFVRLFFEGVARGDTELAWLTPDLAPATSLLLQVALVIAALFFAAPVVTGDPEGGLARLGAAVLITLGISATPVIASGVIGTWSVFTRRLPIGTWVEIGGRVGRVRSVGLIDVRLEDAEGLEVRVMHLVTLWHPTRLLGAAPEATVLLHVSTGADLKRASEIIAAVATRHDTNARVDLEAIDADSARFRITLQSVVPGGRSRLLMDLAAALAEAGLPLGKARRG
jgi:hypothetical protein